MMKTRYLTFILRIRLDESPSQEPAEGKILGSVQQVGFQEIYHFDTAAKFLDMMQSLAAGATITEVKYGKPD
jgi:hypothetical protein